LLFLLPTLVTSSSFISTEFTVNLNRQSVNAASASESIDAVILTEALVSKSISS
jgi:hypothetical protein